MGFFTDGIVVASTVLENLIRLLGFDVSSLPVVVPSFASTFFLLFLVFDLFFLEAW